MLMRNTFLRVACLSLSASFCLGQTTQHSTTAITKDALMKTTSFLANPSLSGRLPGSVGYNKAAQYISDEFAKINIKPLFSNGYKQKFYIEYNEILPGESFSIIKNGTSTKYKLGQDYIYRGFTGSGSFTAHVVFCGYGLSQPEIGYDDYAGIDVKGKVVMVYKFNPVWKLDGKNFTNGYPRKKSIVAIEHGAIGIIFVSPPNDKEPQQIIGSVLHGEGEQPVNFPQLHVNLALAKELYEGTGYNLNNVQSMIDSCKKPFSFELKNSVEINVKTEYDKERETENVCALIEGSDPAMKYEYIIIGAHLDHVGEQAGTVLFPGANDNASGSAAVLQLARAFSNLEIKPKCSICFVLFAGEEQGLNGSKYFSENLPFNKEKVKVMINMDCIASGDSIQVLGGESFRDLWRFVKSIDEKNDKLLVNNTGKGGGADAQPFFDAGIPTLYFVTTNGYKHLHLPSDTPETLNPDLFEAITRLAFLAVHSIAY
jgi:hypothetical protein